MTPSARIFSISLRVRNAGRFHRLAGALDGAADAGLTDKHVMRFFRQHEAAGSRERIEARLRERLELHFAVAVGEEREHEKGQPVGRRLVERAEHARAVLVTGAAAQQFVRLLAAVAAKIFLQQIDHRPQVAAFFHVDLKEVAQIVERGCGLAEVALLLDRRRLGVTLDDDEAAQHRAIFAGHFLPRGLALMLAEVDRAAFFLRREQHTPAVLRHLHVVELRPAFRIDGNRCAQIDERLLETFRPHVVPPVDIARMPAFQRLEHLPVVREIDVVGDLGRVIDVQRGHGLLPNVCRALLPAKAGRRWFAKQTG